MRKLKLEELGRPDFENYSQLEKINVVLVLDNVRSGMNVGSFFRTADAFLISAIYLTGISAAPPHKEINKTAIGAEHSVRWKYFQSTTEALHELKQQGFEIIGVEQTDSSVLMQDFKPEKSAKIALIFGNEVDGLSDEILTLLDKCIEIPQFGTKHSLNVSVSAGIVIWHVFHEMVLRK